MTCLTRDLEKAKKINPIIISNYCQIYHGYFSSYTLYCSLKTDYQEPVHFVQEQAWYKRQGAEGISHPNLAIFLDADEKNDVKFVAIEFLPFTLKSIVEDRAEIFSDVGIAGAVLLDVVAGMSYLHRKEIAHRQLNPYNVFLAWNLTAKIGNFYAYGERSVQCGELPSIVYDPDNQESSAGFLPADYKHKFGGTLDYFAFGCLVLFVFTKEWPTPNAEFVPLQDGSAEKRSEVKRREPYIEDMEKVDNIHPNYLNVVKTCLSDTGNLRNDFEWMYEQLRDHCNQDIRHSDPDALVEYWLNKVPTDKLSQVKLSLYSLFCIFWNLFTTPLGFAVVVIVLLALWKSTLYITLLC